MNQRLKQLRKKLNLTQMEFANKIGSSQNMLSGYEIGRCKPSSPVINNICKTFGVSERWLRTGEGEMFVVNAADEEIAMYVNSVLHDEPESIRRRFISALASLSDDDLRAVERFARALLHDGVDDAADPGDE